MGLTDMRVIVTHMLS